ncbi:MAG: hypothetical protein FD165_380 [Gammaproteobacteria bacterium]|nr:MAG: hypothetical protein FD165_380 [Gammaproteobacteria bacterium]TND04801.1 MAG: hypothetical protein FD120_1368 [Gammaproteobacteria bacterium]
MAGMPNSACDSRLAKRMQFTLDSTRESYTIRAYSPGQVSVNLPVYRIQQEAAAVDPNLPAQSRITQVTVTRSAVVSAHRLIEDWAPQAFDELRAEHFDELAAFNPEIVLIGCGERLRWPDPALISRLQRQGIGVEVMDTGAACRTFNILIAEQRNVVAALLL